MVKRGRRGRPQASVEEAQHGLFCGTGRFGQGHERLRSQKLRMLLTHRKLLQAKAGNPSSPRGEIMSLVGRWMR